VNTKINAGKIILTAADDSVKVKRCLATAGHNYYPEAGNSNWKKLFNEKDEDIECSISLNKEIDYTVSISNFEEISSNG